MNQLQQRSSALNKLLPHYQLLICCILLSAFTAQTYAGELTIDVLDAVGTPIENAVVYAEPEVKGT